MDHRKAYHPILLVLLLLFLVPSAAGSTYFYVTTSLLTAFAFCGSYFGIEVPYKRHVLAIVGAAVAVVLASALPGGIPGYAIHGKSLGAFAFAFVFGPMTIATSVFINHLFTQNNPNHKLAHLAQVADNVANPVFAAYVTAMLFPGLASMAAGPVGLIGLLIVGGIMAVFRLVGHDAA